MSEREANAVKVKRHVDLNVSQNWPKPQNNCLTMKTDSKLRNRKLKAKVGERKSRVTDNDEEKKSDLMIK